VIHPRGPRRATYCRRLAILVFPFFLLSFAGAAQEKPKPTGPARPVKQQTAAATESKTQKDPVEESYRAAETFQLAGDLTAAEKEYRHVISLALQRMAAIRVLARDNSQALVFLKSATAADPSDLEAQMGLASLYLRSRDLAHGKATLQAILTKNEHQPGANDLLGKILFMEGDYAGAADQLKAAWAENPEIDVAYSLALTYLKLNQVANAANLFDEMLTSLGSSAELHVLIGRAYQEGGQFDLASEEFHKALILNPAVARAHSYLGTVYLLQRGDAGSKDALQEFKAELVHNPSDYSSHFHVGVQHFKQHEWRAAELELNKAIQLQPDSAEAYFYLGSAQKEAGNNQASLAQFEKAIRLYGSNSRASQPAHEAYAKALETLGKHELAQHELDTARGLGISDGKTDLTGRPGEANSDDEIQAAPIPSAPNSGTQKIPTQYLAGLKEAMGNSYHNLGVIFARRSQYEEAANFFAEAEKWSPEIKALDKNWGTASFRANQYKAAIAPLERHLFRDPQDASARQMLALSYFMTEDFPKAAATFRPILPALPDNPSLLYAAGISLARSGDSNGASEIFQRMLVQNPDAAEVHLFLGQAHAQQKEDADALKDFSRALELNPKLPEANYGAGMIHLRQGDREQAKSDFQAELAVNPRDASAEYRLGYILLGEQRQAEAIEMLGDVVRQKPDDADAHYGLGKAFLEKGDLKPAVERLETAIRLDPGQPNAYYQLSLAYSRQGRTQEAETTLRQYEKLKQSKSKPSHEIESGTPR
jgi:tetratricopeptide (TPR) repeat protein